MSRIPFDQFSKQYLEDLLAPLGQVETSLEVPGEARFVDIWFSPSPHPTIPPERLGLLGRIALTTCLIEPFRNQPSLTEIRNCLLKLFLSKPIANVKPDAMKNASPNPTCPNCGFSQPQSPIPFCKTSELPQKPHHSLVYTASLRYSTP